MSPIDYKLVGSRSALNRQNCRVSFNERKHKMAKRKAKKKAARKKTAKRKKAAKGLWSASDIKLLKKLFANNPTAELAAKLRRKTDAVKKKASRMGLRKSKRYMKSLGRG